MSLETDHGDIAVRQPETFRSRKIHMSTPTRPYTYPANEPVHDAGDQGRGRSSAISSPMTASMSGHEIRRYIKQDIERDHGPQLSCNGRRVAGDQVRRSERCGLAALFLAYVSGCRPLRALTHAVALLRLIWRSLGVCPVAGCSRDGGSGSGCGGARDRPGVQGS